MSGAAPSPADLGGYVLETQLGQGGMGAVWRARHPGMPGAVFAVKVLPSGQRDPEAVARFRREMEALATTSRHRNVVRIHGGDAAAKTPYIVMELVRGAPLSKLSGGKALEPARAARILRDVADAIAFAHAQGVLHRDLKPENVLVEEGDRPRVCDFGLAALAGQERFTATQASLGTVAYSAPEQLDGRAREADARADVYGLGSVLFFLLTGRAPFEGHGPGLLKRVLLEPAPAPASLVPAVPHALDLVCAHALEKDPDERYATAAELRDDLDRVLRGETPSVHDLTPGERVRRWVRRRRRRVLAGLGLVAAAATVVGAVAALDWARHAQGEWALVEAEAAGAPVAVVVKDLATVVRTGGSPDHVERASRALEDAVARTREAREVKDALEALPPHLAPELRPRLGAAFVAARERARREKAGGEALASADVAALEAAARDAGLADALAGVPGRPIPLGDALVDSGALPRAEALARARLARTPDDAGGRALRARVLLASAGAPSWPLGGGRLDVAAIASESILADLEAASRLEGAAGARAAWLRAELLAVAGAADPAARAAERARELGAKVPDAGRAALLPEAPLLQDVLAASLDAVTFGKLTKRVEGKREPRAVRALAVFLARAGVRDALEDPGAAERDLVAVSPPPEFPVEELRSYAPRLGRTAGEPPDEETGDPAAWQALAAEAQLRRRPHDPEILGALGSTQGLAGLVGLGAVFRVLQVRESGHDFYSLSGEVMGDPEFLMLREGEATDEFARNLASRVEGAPLVEPLRARLGPEVVERAVRGAIGLRRVNELDDLSVRNPVPQVRERLAFEALRELAALRELGGPAVLVYRARLRRHAFPGRLGAWLARADLERLASLATRARDLGLDPPAVFQVWRTLPQWSVTLYAATAAAWCPVRREPQDRDLAGLVPRLLALGDRWMQEEGVARAAYGVTTRLPEGKPSHGPVADYVEALAKSVSSNWSLVSRAVARAEKLGLREPPPPLDEKSIVERVLVPGLTERATLATYRFESPASEPR